MVSSSWLTAVRLDRLCTVVTAIPSSQLGLTLTEVLEQAYDSAGGPMEEIGDLLALSKLVGLCTESKGVIRRTRDGDRVVKAMRAGDRTLLGRALIRAGVLHDQARYLIESGRVGADGGLQCELRKARAGAPQLLGLLQWWPDLQVLPTVNIPKVILAELDTIWALLPPPVETPTWVMERKAIGDRAEMYTVQVEKLAADDPTAIAWVARDSDSLGWDVEDRTATPPRRIEVKGSREAEPVFFLSDNEWRRAAEHSTQYEIQFWGGIDLSRQPADEFQSLRERGYPVVVTDIVARVSEGAWRAEPVRWRVYRGTPIGGPSPPIPPGAG
jgi:hypothetical protein